MQQGFVNIETLFNEQTPRTVESLRELYNDPVLLQSVIKNLSGEVLNEENLQGKKILLKPNWVKHS